MTFLLGKLGGTAAAQFAAKLAPSGITPRHCAVLELTAHESMSQLELANRVGVTPSVVVDMLDELEPLGAIKRVADPSDRRRRIISLTPAGRKLHALAVAAAAAVDQELLDGLKPGERTALVSALRHVGAAAGFDFA